MYLHSIDQKQSFRHFIFDFDGTLADTMISTMNTINRLSRKYKFKPIDPKDLPKLRCLSAREFIKEQQMNSFLVPFILGEGIRCLKKEIHTIPFVAESLKQILEQLKSECSLQLGIVTSNSKANVNLFLESHQLSVFDFIESSSSLWSKPKHLKKVMKKHNLSTSDTLYIGDEIRDIHAAREAKLAIAAVSWGFNTSEVLAEHHPDFLLQHPKDLLNLTI